MKTRKNVKLWIAITVLCVLVVAFAILLPIFLKSNQENRDIYQNQKVMILRNGELLKECTLEDMLELSPAVDFDAVYKPNNALPIKRTYTGIYLKDLLVALDINLDEVAMVRFKAMDGVEKIYSIADVIAKNNVYIAFKVNGEPINNGIDSFAYSNPQEDGGPFVVIKANDAVSQNRVKLLTEIDIT